MNDRTKGDCFMPHISKSTSMNFDNLKGYITPETIKGAGFKKGGARLGATVTSKLNRIANYISEAIQRPFTGKKAEWKSNQVLVKQLDEYTNKMHSIFKNFFNDIHSIAESSQKELKKEQKRIEHFDKKLIEIKNFINVYKDRFSENEQKDLRIIQQKINEAEQFAHNALDFFNDQINEKDLEQKIYFKMHSKLNELLTNAYKLKKTNSVEFIKNLKLGGKGHEDNGKVIATLKELIKQVNTFSLEIEQTHLDLKTIKDRFPNSEVLNSKVYSKLQEQLSHLKEEIDEYKVVLPSKAQELTEMAEFLNLIESASKRILELSDNAKTNEEIAHVKKSFIDLRELYNTKNDKKFFKEDYKYKDFCKNILDTTRDRLEAKFNSFNKTDKADKTIEPLKNTSDITKKVIRKQTLKNLNSSLEFIHSQITRLEEMSEIIPKLPDTMLNMSIENINENLRQLEESLKENLTDEIFDETDEGVPEFIKNFRAENEKFNQIKSSLGK